MRAERRVTQGRAGRTRLWGAVLAIAALLVQLLVSAGHFHPEDFRFSGGGHGATLTAGTGGGTGWPGAPSGAPAHDDCAVCFSLYLAGSTALPNMALPPVPSEPHQAALVLPAERWLAAAPYLLFRTRAPPTL